MRKSSFIGYFSHEKQEVLKRYGFIKGYVEQKITDKIFLDDLNVFLKTPEFEKELRDEGFNELDMHLIKAFAGGKESEECLRAIEILSEKKFPFDTHSELGNFLIEHPSDVIELGRLFQYAYVKWGNDLADLDWLINENTWKDLMDMLRVSGREAHDIIAKGLPGLRDLITDETWHDMVKMVISSKANGPDLLIKGIPAIRKHINPNTWPHIVDFVVYSKQCAADVFTRLFPEMEDLLTDDMWPELVDFAKSAGYGTYFLIKNGVLVLSKQIKTGTISKDDWPFFIEGIGRISKSAGEGSHHLFNGGFPLVKDFLNKKNWPMIVDGFIRLVNAAPDNQLQMFESNLSELKKLITQDNWTVVVDGMVRLAENCQEFGHFAYLFCSAIRGINSVDEFNQAVNYMVELSDHIRGNEKSIYYKFREIYRYFEVFGIDFFRLFVLPAAKTQKVGLGLVLHSLGEIYKQDGVKDKEDLMLLTYIATKYSTKASVIMDDILVKGIEKELIAVPISKEAEILKSFLRSAPAFIVDLYPMFKQIFLENEGDERDAKIAELFKDLKEIKEDIYSGVFRKEYAEEIFFATLYFVFACHDVTVPKDNYIKTYKNRGDRESDVPKRFQRPFKVKLSRGDFVLKDSDSPVDTKAWVAIVEVADKVKSKKDFDIAALGFEMLHTYVEDNISQKVNHFIHWVYQYSFNQGESLPSFSNNHGTLIKYKEFVGDRMVNDLIHAILKYSLMKDPMMFAGYQARILGRGQDKAGLVKHIQNVLVSDIDADKKQEVLGRILRKNGYHIKDAAVLLDIDPGDFGDWLSEQTPNVIEKGLIAKIFKAIIGEDYSKMQDEITKYEFKKAAKGVGKTYYFVLSKRKPHCLAMYNMGICVAPDEKLWGQTDFWQLIIFDEDHDANGGAILRTVEEDGKKYLILSIQPASPVLNSVSPVQVYEKIIQFCRIIAKKLKYTNILIPVDTAIHSNRSSIQEIIAEKYGGKATITLEDEHEFSYSPYNYKYKEFYKVW